MGARAIEAPSLPGFWPKGSLATLKQSDVEATKEGPEGTMSAFVEKLQYESDKLHEFALDCGVFMNLESLADVMGGNAKRLTLDVSGGHSWIITRTPLGLVVSFWCAGDAPTDVDRVHIPGVCQ